MNTYNGKINVINFVESFNSGKIIATRQICFNDNIFIPYTIGMRIRFDFSDCNWFYEVIGLTFCDSSGVLNIIVEKLW